MRRKDENEFKKWLVDKLKHHMHVQSHEDKYSCGIPDLDFCGHIAARLPVAGWIELKIIKDWPIKPTTSLHSLLHHMTHEQMNWMHKRFNHGGVVFLMVKVIKTREWLLFAGKDARQVKDSTKEQCYDLALNRWTTNLPTDELVFELIG